MCHLFCCSLLANPSCIIHIMKTKHALRTLMTSSIFLICMPAIFAQSAMGDLLLYFDTSREPPAISAYNPTNGERIQLPVSIEVESIITSGDGRIAYVEDNDVWVLDVLNTPDSPINVTQTPAEQERLMNWTPDGRFLQYQVGSNSHKSLLYIYDGHQVFATDYGHDLNRHWNENGWYVAPIDNATDNPSWQVWNGQEYIALEFPLLSGEPVWQSFQWTPNNHLFITIGYSEHEYMQPIGPTDLFYWNGRHVQEVENPSQDETFMLGEWSVDGRLTLYTSQDFFDRWYIWDGMTFTEQGVPDTSTLTTVNGSTETISDIQWMPDGRLAVVTQGNPESDSLLGHPFSCDDSCVPQVFLWDQQALIQVTSNDFSGLLIDVHNNGYITVSDFDGLRIWGVTVFDNNLESVFQSDGAHPHTLSRWSADGNLAYCQQNDLMVWNGVDTTRLSSRSYSKWLLAQSPTMLCSTG